MKLGKKLKTALELIQPASGRAIEDAKWYEPGRFGIKEETFDDLLARGLVETDGERFRILPAGIAALQ